MSERLETLKKARERMIEDRDAHAKVLAAPFDRDKAERARVKFTEIQTLVDALDRAIVGEEAEMDDLELLGDGSAPGCGSGSPCINPIFGPTWISSDARSRRRSSSVM